MAHNDDFYSLAREDYCYVTSKGRITGKPHRIEIWFGMQGWTIYLLSGDGKSDWVKNMRVDALVDVEIGKQTFKGHARIVTDVYEDGLSRRLVASKYQHWQDGQEFSDWARTAVPVAIDISF